MSKKEPYKCVNCGHALMKHTSPAKVVTWLHFNRWYYGSEALNHKHCASCEVEWNKGERKFKEICNKPVHEKRQWVRGHYIDHVDNFGRKMKKWVRGHYK